MVLSKTRELVALGPSKLESKPTWKLRRTLTGVALPALT
jgi:hypothetical protein